MKENDELYRKTVKSQADLSLKYIGKKLADEELGFLESESIDFKIPEHLQNKLNALIKEDNIQKRKQKFYRSLAKLSKICSIFVAAVIIIGVFSYKNVSAFKYQFDNFIAKIKEEYIELEPNDTDKLSSDGLWTLSYLPKGYSFSDLNIDDDFQETSLTFVNDRDGSICLIYSPAVDTKLHLDNEAEQSDKIVLNGKYTAYWSQNGQSVDLCWLRDDNIFILRGLNLELSEMIKMAENIYYKYN